MSTQAPGATRLDSWKAIAAYLNRDVATVRRWERSLGLPVRRVAGSGRSVFAYTSEIDAWLATGAAADPAPAPATVVDVDTATSRRMRSLWWLPALVAIGALGIMSRAWLRAPAIGDLQFEAADTAVIARDDRGNERWRHDWGAGFKHVRLPRSEWVHVSTGKQPLIYVATTYRQSLADQRTSESGRLTALSRTGRERHSFSFGDQVGFGGQQFGTPWALTSFAVQETASGPRVAVAAHHFMWEPSLVTVLNADWQRTGTFAHAGWIEDVHWLGPERLAISGFSNALDGGMVALLDANALDGQGPEAPGSKYFCNTCGPARPLRMFVLPRTELNRITNSRFNRAILRLTSDRVVASTTEMPPTDDGGVDAIYEFTRSLDFVGASFSDRYWDMHRALEEQGQLDHTRATCPDADGPREIKVWSPESGWRTIPARR